MDRKEEENLNKNSKLWSNILKNDEQFDYSYLEIIILHKIKLMRKYYLSGESPIEQEAINRIVKEMTIVIKGLERLIADDYIKIPDGKEPEFLETEDDNGLILHEMTYHADFPKEKIEEIYKEADKNKLKDRHLVYDSLRDKATGWWD